MPDGAVYVGRPTKYGNPYRVGALDPLTGSRMTVSDTVRMYRWYLSSNDELCKEVKRELAGKDLVCWCALDQPCHADVLLELANEGL